MLKEEVSTQATPMMSMKSELTIAAGPLDGLIDRGLALNLRLEMQLH